MSPASSSARRSASQPGLALAQQPGGEVGEFVDVLAGVVEVDDLGGGGKQLIGEVPDPDRPVAEDDELADVLAAAAAGFGVHELGEPGSGFEGGQVAGGARVTDRVAVVIGAGLGEQAGEFDLAGVRPAVFALAGAALGLSRDHGHAGAVDGDVKHVRQRRGRREGHHLPGADRLSLRGDGRAGRGAVGFGGPLDPLGGQAIPASSASRPPALANGTAAAARAVIARSPGDIEACADAEFSVPGRDPVPALRRSDTRPGAG